MPQLEIYKYLTVSLYHLPKENRDQILNAGDDCPFSSWASDVGAFVYVSEPEIISNPDYGLPQSVVQLFALAREHGCQYIQFDCDAEELEGFEVFAEEEE